MAETMTALHAFSEQAKTDPGGAGREMALALMRGDADSYKAGYTAENAVLAAQDYLNGQLPVESHVDYTDVARALTPDPQGDDFVAFLHYLADEMDATIKDVIYAVEKPGKFWAQYADYLIAREDNTAGVITPLGARA